MFSALIQDTLVAVVALAAVAVLVRRFAWPASHSAQSGCGACPSAKTSCSTSAPEGSEPTVHPVLLWPSAPSRPPATRH